LIAFWKRCHAEQTFPFSKRFALDTMQIQVLLDIIKDDDYCENYSLKTLVEKYGVKREKAHRSENDVKMTKDVFIKQIELLKNKC